MHYTNVSRNLLKYKHTPNLLYNIFGSLDQRNKYFFIKSFRDFSQCKYVILNKICLFRNHNLSSKNLDESENKKKLDCPVDQKKNIVVINFILKDGSDKKVLGKEGDNLLHLAHSYQIEIEGACEASLACSTCHVILDEDSFNKLPEASEREDDLLDLAPNLSNTSRLSCQIHLNKEIDGMKVKLPKSTVNFYVDGHVVTPH